MDGHNGIAKHDVCLEKHSPYLLRHSEKFLRIGVNGSNWEVGFELFPKIPYDFLTHWPQNLPLEQRKT